jgi:hypothetical protein
MRQHVSTSERSRYPAGLPWLRHSGGLLVLCGILCAMTSRSVTAAESATPSAADHDFFETKVRPLLLEHCAACHSHEAGEPEGGLSFDSRADFRAAEGIAVAGHPDESLIVKVVRYDGDLQMPPDGRLAPEAIRTIEEWVRRGLPWPDDGKPAGSGEATAFDIAKRKAEHWCWEAPRAAAVPTVRAPGWCRTDIDRFVLARLEKAGLEPAPEAGRAVLVRRASEILTGLPADPADVDRVVADSDPRAFENYVDQLLASPHYGERFARHWLDIVRYGESRGHESDYIIPNAFQYRDWVIRALNADLPYDQFVREQIAGDLVDQPRIDPQTGANESVIGTGFWLLGEEVHSPVDIQQDEADRIDNRIDTFGKAFLGLALGCARCHDHKFDAISNEDYYAIAGMVMSSSYRQVPFETLEANRAVAAGIAAADADARRAVLPLLADVVAARRDDAGPLLAAPGGGPPKAGATASPPAEIVMADYTAGAGSTPIIADGAAWEAVPAGTPRLQAVEAEGQRTIRVEPFGHARSDAVWSTTRSIGERDPGKLGQVDRAGRVLRTPKRRLTQGVLWHRVRGKLQIYATVDSHILLPGPLHNATLLTVDTKGEWQWIRHDLGPTISWQQPHVVHVEFAAIEGEAAVAESVAASVKPERGDALAAAVVGAVGDGQAAAAALVDAAAAACRAGSLGDGPRAELLATVINRTLASPQTRWMDGVADRAVAEAMRRDAVRTTLVANVKLTSAVAPAILDGNGIDQFVLLKGSAARPGELSPRRFLEAIDGPQQPVWPSASSGRRELADRVLASDNPLVSRVIVNRIWHHLFGRGLVPTTDNFGKLGEPAADPTAQALLDTLAVRFVAEGWSLKRLLREIVTSSTWRMATAADPRAIAQDPLNVLLHHHPLRRLEGEAIRDKILAVSGRLERTFGGPSIPAFLSEFQDGRGKPDQGPLDGAGRRSIYTSVRRNFLPAFQVAFDMPVPFQAMGRRNVTNVPAQSLTLMNDPFVHEQAVAWARRMLIDPAPSPEARIERMYREAFARPPAPEERAAAVDFLAAQAATHGVRWAGNERHEATWADLAHALFNTKEFIFIP